MSTQFNPPHPGIVINDICIKPFEKVTIASVARAMEVSTSAFSRLLAGKAAISPTMAIKLSAVLGRSPESWLLMQAHYDLWHARQTVDTQALHRFNFEEPESEELKGFVADTPASAPAPHSPS